MYEIWLVINIVWEIALGFWPLLLLAALAWAVLMALALKRRGRGGLAGTVAAGAVVAVLAFVAVPMLTKSSLAELAYWVDWANLSAIALGAGVVAAAFAWPLLRLRTPAGLR